MFEIPLSVAFLFCILAGLFLGSLFNRLILRMPFDKPLFPREVSACCQKRMPFIVNLPVLGFFLLKGKCPHCKNKLPKFRLFVEIFTPVVAVVAFIFGSMLHHSLDNFYNTAKLYDIFVLEWFFLTLIPVFYIDFKYHLIPDTVTVGSIVFGILISFVPGHLTPLESVIHALISFVSLYLFIKIIAKILKKNAMGFGDIKMFAGFGAIFSFPLAVESLILASVLGVCIVFPVRLLWSKAFQTKEQINPGEFPFGPFLAVSAPIIYVFGNKILDYYLSLFVV